MDGKEFRRFPVELKCDMINKKKWKTIQHKGGREKGKSHNAKEKEIKQATE